MCAASRARTGPIRRASPNIRELSGSCQSRWGYAWVATSIRSKVGGAGHRHRPWPEPRRRRTAGTTERAGRRQGLPAPEPARGAVDRLESVDVMKRLASRLTWWHKLPHKSRHAVNAAERRGASHGLYWHRARCGPRGDVPTPRVTALMTGEPAVHGFDRGCGAAPPFPRRAQTIRRGPSGGTRQLGDDRPSPGAGLRRSDGRRQAGCSSPRTRLPPRQPPDGVDQLRLVSPRRRKLRGVSVFQNSWTSSAARLISGYTLVRISVENE